MENYQELPAIIRRLYLPPGKVQEVKRGLSGEGEWAAVRVREGNDWDVWWYDGERGWHFAYAGVMKPNGRY